MTSFESASSNPLRTISGDLGKPEDREDHDVGRGEWENNWSDVPAPDPDDPGGWDRSYNQEIHGDETGGPEPERP